MSWEKGFKESRIQGFECLFSRDLIITFSILLTSPSSLIICEVKPYIFSFGDDPRKGAP